MKSKLLYLTVILLCVMLLSCAEVLSQMSTLTPSTSGGLTREEIIRGLKEALIVGATNSTSLASQTDGFHLNTLIRIPFPQEAIQVKKTVDSIGLSNLTKDFEKSLNRAAEEASKKAFPIFKNAIVGITINDGIGILRGPKNAATEYLKNRTRNALIAEFTPVVTRAIESVQVTKYWTPIAQAYNKTTILTGEKAVNPNLPEYVTQKTIDGLFTLIAAEELKIRENPAARVSDILKKVFGSL